MVSFRTVGSDKKKKRKTPLAEQAEVKSFDPDPLTRERSRVIVSGGKDATSTTINPNAETFAFETERANKIHAENEARKAALGEFRFIVAAAEKGIINPKQAGRMAREIEARNQTQPKEGEEQIPEGRAPKEDQGILSSIGKGLNLVDTLGGIVSPELQKAGGGFGGSIPLGGPQILGLPGQISKAQAIISTELIAHRLTRTAVAGTNILQREQLLGLGTRTATRSFIGKPGNSGVNKVFRAGGIATRQGRDVAMNTKTMAQAETILNGGIFSQKAIVFFGAWASSVFLGRWAQAEAAEPILFPLRDELKQAQFTGDFSIYDEFSEAAKEISDPSIWREIALWSPIAAIPGIQNKMKGVRKGIELLDKIAERR